jgi:hypothetical protein
MFAEGMKHIWSIIGLIALSAIFLPLLAALLFAMPLEFGVATWHNLRLDATTDGSITHSEVTRQRGSNEGSSMAYSYGVDGSSYLSSRWRAGLFSNSSREDGGGEFAKNHPVGTSVQVFYDSSNPEFSMLERGWPKWSLGFSMAVWGILSSYYFNRSDPKTRRLFVAYPLSRALTITGFFTIVLLPPTLDHETMQTVMIGFVVIALGALGWLLLPVARNTNSEQDVGGQPATPPRVGD